MKSVTPIRFILLFVPAICVANASAGVSFNRDIRPIFAENCYKCHGPDARVRKADLRLDRHESGALEKILKAGDPGASELYRRVTTGNPDDRMPPPESELSLTPAQKEKLREWIAAGAEWEDHWSFAPVRRPELPEVERKDWPRNPIDRFVLAGLEQEGLEPSAEAPKETLIRRVSLDLTGLPPTPAEVEAFLSDSSPRAYAKQVDRLLRSRRYGERMAWQWLEAARYADTDGYQNDGPRDMWRWRDWVIAAYNANMPFDRFTIEQLAGDLLPEPTLDQRIATGFNRNHRYNSEAGLVQEEFLLENAADRVETTGAVWMGLTLTCSRCHNHKYDPVSQKEYYRMIACFNSVPESGRAIKFGNSEPWIKAPTEAQQAELVSKGKELAEARTALKRLEDVIAVGQEKWERSGVNSEKPFLAEGLEHWFDFDADDARVKAEKGGPVLREGFRGKSATVGGNGQFALGKIGKFICNGRFSISFWVRAEDVAQGAILSQETTDTTRKGLLVELDDGRIRYHLISRWIAGVATLETVEPIPVGEWLHVALTNDGTQRADGMAIWLNGRKVATRTLYNTNSNKAGKAYGGVLRIGGSPHAPHFKGQVDELRIYHRTLWDDEIVALSEKAAVAEIAAVPAAERTPKQADKIRRHFLATGAPDELAALWKEVGARRVAKQAFEDSLPTTMVMQEMETPRPSYIRVRGVYHRHGEQVGPGVPASLSKETELTPPNRLGFARWLVGGEHPLTARVTVNRYWQLLFGAGLVRTPEDFGAQGELPTHPELLDWLASEFVRLDWDIKALLKTMVMSATYRQSSQVTPGLLAQDPDNRLLARMSRVRLPGNVLRDQALAVSGLLKERLGGPSVKPYQPKNLWREASNFSYKADRGEALYRRSLYTYWKRTLAPPSMATLDAADREWCSVKPRRTNTPLQALTLLNETAFFEAARKLGERLLREGGDSDPERARLGFRMVTSRDPSERELELLTNAYGEYRAEFESGDSQAKAVLKTGESKATKDFAEVEIAAAAALANVLLNLDEATTRE